MDNDTANKLKKITYRPAERMRILREMDLPERSFVFERLSPYVQQSILKQLKIPEIVELLDHLDLQKARQILALLTSEKTREKVLHRLKGEVKEKLEYFLRFHPKATFSLINFNYLYLSSDLTIGEAADLIDEHYNETTHFPEVLVHDRGTLIGEVPLSVLLKENNDIKIRDFVNEVKTIFYHSDINTVVETLINSDCKKVIVLDHDGSVLGLIYINSAKTLFGNLKTDSLYDFAGVDSSERPFDSVWTKVSNRYRWLVFNLATCFLASGMVLLFQDTLDTLTILSIYIPIVTGMGGNAATQSFAIMVRGLTLGSVSLKNVAPALWSEIMAGVINGVIIGTIVAIVSVIWNGQVIIGLIVALAMIIAHTIASIAGTLVPLLMKHWGKDPASTSSIFISTVTDTLGIFFLLGLATLILL